MECYSIDHFIIENDHVVIGKRENLPIAFVPKTDKYIAIDGDDRKIPGYMETVIRFLGYDVRKLLL